MPITFKYPTSKTDYSWIGDRTLNPSYDQQYDPYVTFGAKPSLYDFAGYKYLPSNLETSILRYKETFIQEVNGNPLLNSPAAELATKDWNKLIDPVIPDHVSINLIDQQWSNVINTAGFNENVSVAYINNGFAPAGETYVGGGGKPLENVILINSTFPDYDTKNLSIGTWGGWMLMHELGHVYGVFHGNDVPVQNERPELLRMSVMWYPQKGNYSAAKIPLTPGMDDISALQANPNYGVSHAQDGNTSYVFTQSSIDLGHGNVLAGLQVNVNIKNYVMTLWDGPGSAGGTDTIDASALGTKTYIDLRDGHFSAIGTDTNSSDESGIDHNVGIAHGAQIENAKGGSGNDYLKGNDQNNELTGNGGNDTLEGGLGTDTYVYTSGDGTDTLVDVDGLGTIQWDGLTLAGRINGVRDDFQRISIFTEVL